MNAPPEIPAPTASRKGSPFSVWRRVVLGAIGFIAAYLVAAYLVVPLFWMRYASRHPALEEIPNITYTGDKHPGDPINVALFGTEDEMKQAMLAARWFPADPLTLRSCLEIAADTVLERPYKEAPVSNLFLWGRKQDLAFEMPVGSDPRERHHVRFWRSEKTDDKRRPLWVGSATFDKRVGLSRTTGEVTHHIAADVDAEREHLLTNLEKTGLLTNRFWVEDFHQPPSGYNGGGDPWHTDGRLGGGVLRGK